MLRLLMKRYVAPMHILFGILGLALSLPSSAQTPTIATNLNVDSFLGEQACFNADFTNVGPTGYGPYVLVILPPSIDPGTVSATVFGGGAAGTVSLVGPIPANDPIEGTQYTTPVGGNLLLIQFPVGSLTTASPPLDIELCADIPNTVTPGDVQEIQLIPGYEFGDTPTGDNGPIIGTGTDPTQGINPVLAILTKINTAPENERPPGPSFPFNYEFSLDIANTATLDNVVLTDILPPTMQWIGSSLTDITITFGPGGGGPCSATSLPNIDPIPGDLVSSGGIDNPGGTLALDCGSVTGAVGSGDITVSLEVYVTDVLNETVFDTDQQPNPVTANADYQGNALPQLTADDGSGVLALLAAIQKGVDNDTPIPGDTLTYSMNMQITDYVDTAAPTDPAVTYTIVDILPDGVTFQSTTSLVINGTTVPITPTVQPSVPNPGETTVTWDVLAAATAASVVMDAGTSGTLIYQAVVDQTYEGTNGPVGDPVRSNDGLSNTAQLIYELADGGAGTNGTGASVVIEPIALTKTILNPQAQYQPGDIIFYQLQTTITSGDADQVTLIDTLPLPVNQVADLPTGPPILVATPTTTDPANYTYHFAPAVGGGVTVENSPPLVTPDVPGNSVSFNFGNIDIDPTQSITVTVIIPAIVSDEPFADGLFLTNILTVSTDNTPGTTITGTDLTFINIGAPELTITKGVLSTDGEGTIAPPASTLPVDGDLTNADAGDQVVFQITVENIGSEEAFQVTITDPSVAGLTCALDTVTDGAGTALTFTGSITTGITLDNELQANDGTIGAPFSTDTALANLNCTLDSSVEPTELLTNSAQLQYAQSATATTLFPAISDDASVTIAPPSIDKDITAIQPGYSGNLTSAHIGEVLTYQVDLTIPEGTSQNVRLVDTLDAGLTFTDVVSVTPSANVSFTGPGTGVISPAGSDSVLTINFGTVTNTNSNPADETIAVIYRVRVLNVTTNQTGTLLNNSAVLSLDDPAGGTQMLGNSAPEVGVIEPALTITKTFSPDTGDAGDTSTVTLLIENNSGVTAFDVTLEDMIPGGLTYEAASVSNTAGIAPTTGPSESGGTISAAWDSLADGESSTITFQVTVDAGVAPNTPILNTATVDWESLLTADEAALPSPPTNTNGVERTGDPADPGEENNYTASGNDTFTTIEPTVSKTLDSSSETFTSDITPVEAAIGEVLTYEVEITLPEGVTLESALGTPILIDTLPAGFAYINGTATIVANGAGITTATAFPAGVPITPTAVTPNPNGQDLEFDLGSITVPVDNIPGSDTLTIVYNVLVENTSDNNRGVDKINRATVNYENSAGTAQSTFDTELIDIVEPIPVITKTATPTTVQGNDTVQFTVEFTNQTGTSATRLWEPVINDPLPTEYVAPFAISTTSPPLLSRGDTELPAACSDITGGVLNVDLSCLPAADQYLDPGESITVVYTATVDPDIAFETTVTNTAEAVGTSLPGNQGTGSATPGNPGDADGERTGTGGVNDLVSTADADVTSDRPTITKTGDASLQIGDVTTMRIEFDLPIGTTTNIVVTDNLPIGLTYTNAPITITIPADVINTLNPPTTPGVGTDPLVFNFGDIDNNSGGAATISIEYEVRVDNILANQRNSALMNQVDLSYTGITAPVTDDATITVIEPDLEISKLVSAGGTGADAGDAISYEFTITNTDLNGTAYRVDLSDVLPADLLGALNGDGLSPPFFTNITLANPNGVTINGSATVLSAIDAVFATTTIDGDTLTWPLFDMPPGSTMTVRYDAIVANTAVAGAVLANQVDVNYSSQALDDPNARTGDPNTDDDDDTDLNNYAEQTDATITLDASIMIQKSLDPTTLTEYSIGDTVVYNIRIDVDEGTTNNVVISDVLPTGLQLTNSSIVADPVFSFTNPGTASATTGAIEFDVGNVTNVADMDTTNDFFIIRVEAIVLNDTVNNNSGDMKTNAASVSSDSGNAGPVDATIDIVEPELNVTKTADDNEPSLGDTVTFTIEVAHTVNSSADAQDVILTDAIPAGMTYVLGSAMGPVTVDETDPTAPVFDLGVITETDISRSFSYSATIDSTAVVGQPLTNMLSLDYDTQSGDANPEERSYTGNTDETVTPDINAAIDAQKTVSLLIDGGAVGVADPGDRLRYTVTLGNTGTDTLTTVVFTDTVPANTTYVNNSLFSTAGVTDQTGAPNLVVDGFDLLPSSAVTIRFDVDIIAGTPEGTVISNQGVVDSDQTVPEPTDEDGIDGNGDQPTDISVGGPPPLSNPLYSTKRVELINDVDVSGSVSPGDVLRYTLVVENLGAQPLTGVNLTDTLPTGLTYVPATAIGNPNTITVAGQNVNWPIGVIAPGGFANAVLDMTVDTPLFNSDADPANETFVNQGTVTSNETDPVATDGNTDPSDGEQPTTITATTNPIGTPIINLEKRVSLLTDVNGNGVVDVGDVLRYTMTLENSGSASADNVQLMDNAPTSTTIMVGSLTSSQGIIVTETPAAIALNLGSIPPGGIVTASFDASVNFGAAGSIVENQAQATGDNFPDEDSDDNGDDGDGENPNLTPVAGSGQPTVPAVDKTLFLTDQGASPDPQVLIGEVVTFDIAITVPVGTLSDAIIIDQLPTGLSYVANSAQLLRTFETGLTASNDPGGINATAAGVFVPLNDGTEVIDTGTTVEVNLGTIINSDNDANTEGYTLRLDVLVENLATNNAGVDLTDNGTLRFLDSLGQEQQLIPEPEVITLLEPALQITKTADPTALLTSGGRVQFTIEVTNPTGAFVGPAFDVVIDDALPANYSALTIDSITPTGGVAGITDNTAGTTLNVVVDTFPVDGTLTIVMTATASNPQVAGDLLINTSTVDYTSLPGSSTDERTGTGGIDNYTASDMADVRIGDVNLTKGIDTPLTRYAIGDIVDYEVNMDVPPRAVLELSVITDVLDAGLSYIPGTLVQTFDPDLGVTLAPADFTVTGAVPATGLETLTLDFGTLTNSNDTAFQTLTLTYQARIDNLLSNQDGQGIGNDIELAFGDPGQGPVVLLTDDDNDVTVGEPFLTLEKIITSALTTLEAGDIVDFQVVIGNMGTTTAFDTVIDDALPLGLTNLQALTVTGTTGGAPTPTFTTTATSFTSDPFDLPVGGEITLTFSAEIDTSVLPGEQVQNTVTASFSSRPGADPNERTGADGTEQDDAGSLDNYNESDPSQVLMIAEDVMLDKTFTPDSTDTTYTIGEELTYRLTIDLIEGTLDSVVLTDVLPDFVSVTDINAIVVSLGNVGMTTGFTPPAGQASQTLTFDFGTVSNPSDGDRSNDLITVDIPVRVDNVVDNQNGDTRGNNASLDYISAAGPQLIDFDSNAGTPGNQPLDFTIVEPELELTKSVDPTTISLGDTVTFSLVIDHLATSSSDAFDVEVIDLLPAGLTYVPGSASIAPSNINGQELTFTIPTLTLLNDNTTITYQATVDTTAAFGVPLINNANLTYASTPGGTGAADDGRNGDDGAGGLNDYTDNDTASVTPTIDAQIDAQKTVELLVDNNNNGVADPGDRLRYTVTLSNAGSDVTNVVFTDTVPANTTYVNNTLVSTAGTIDQTGAPTLVVDGFDLPNNGAVTITFDVDVNTGTAAGTVLSNQGVVDSDQTVPEPTDEDGIDSNGDQPTTIPVGGPPPQVNPLYSSKSVELLTDVDASGTVSPADVLRYSFVVKNQGDQPLTGVMLNDTIPTGLTYVPASVNSNPVGAIITGDALNWAIGNLAIGEFVTVVFDVTVNAPLFNSDADAANETFTNQGIADSNETDPVDTDGNNDPSDGEQPTVIIATTGSGAPEVNLEKRVTLLTDVNNNGLVDVGDMLLYTMTLTNNGSATAQNVQLSDAIPNDTSIVVGSVITSQGVVVTESPVLINVGPVTPGGVVSASFEVTVDASASGRVIVNQAQATGDNFVPEDSDNNGSDGDGENPNLTPVTGPLSPPLYSTKTVELLTDVDNSRTISPTDVLRYTVTVQNLGTTPLTGVTFSDNIPTGLTYVAGAAVSNPAGATVTGAVLSWNIGTLGIGEIATLTFSVTIDSPLINISGDGDVANEQFVNQGIADSNETDPVASDSNNDPNDGAQPTTIDATTILPPPPPPPIPADPEAIPTLQTWALMLFSLMLALVSTVSGNRRRRNTVLVQPLK